MAACPPSVVRERQEQQHLVLLVPYRDVGNNGTRDQRRSAQLAVFMREMPGILAAALPSTVAWHIWVGAQVEDARPFCRARVVNALAAMASRYYGIDTILVIHDVDRIPSPAVAAYYCNLVRPVVQIAAKSIIITRASTFVAANGYGNQWELYGGTSEMEAFYSSCRAVVEGDVVAEMYWEGIVHPDDVSQYTIRDLEQEPATRGNTDRACRRTRGAKQAKEWLSEHVSGQPTKNGMKELVFEVHREGSWVRDEGRCAMFALDVFIAPDRVPDGFRLVASRTHLGATYLYKECTGEYRQLAPRLGSDAGGGGAGAPAPTPAPGL